MLSLSCFQCGSRTPIRCATCEQPIGTHHLSAASCNQYPHGSFNAEGQPVCSQHRLTMCRACRSLFPRSETVQQTVAWSRSNRPIQGRLCGSCNIEFTQPNPAPEWLLRLRYGWHIAAIFVAVAVVVGLVLGFSTQFFGGPDNRPAPPPARSAGEVSAPRS